MKITKTQLKQLIKEELERTMSEMLTSLNWTYDKNFIEDRKEEQSGRNPYADPWDPGLWTDEFIPSFMPELVLSKHPDAYKFIEDILQQAEREDQDPQAVYDILAKKLHAGEY